MDAIPQLDIAFYPSQLFWFFLSFGVLYFVVNRSVLPKIESIIRKRYTIAKCSISCVEDDLSLIQKKLAKQLLDLDAARVEVEKIINSAIQEVKETNESVMVALSEEIQEMFNMTDEYLKNTKCKAEQELIDLAVEIALVYYNKMLGSEYVDKDKLRYITTKLYKEKI